LARTSAEARRHQTSEQACNFNPEAAKPAYLPRDRMMGGRSLFRQVLESTPRAVAEHIRTTTQHV
ncbi:hypothetical protein, partial [Klebsiella michiganensis]|uniref:hypothetical protein n=1 Tax=Klebsiella michiganensis TaxID=1134687 RepID=UPI001953380B